MNVQLAGLFLENSDLSSKILQDINSYFQHYHIFAIFKCRVLFIKYFFYVGDKYFKLLLNLLVYLMAFLVALLINFQLHVLCMS